MAGAQDEPEFLTASDLLPGTCYPVVVVPGQLVDCRFPLAEVMPLDDWGPHEAGPDGSYGDKQPCVVIESDLVCRGIQAEWNLGRQAVVPTISGLRSPARAELRVVAYGSQPVVFSPAWGGEPYVLPGLPLAVYVDGRDRTRTAFGVVRSRDDGRVMATVRIPEVRADEYVPVRVPKGLLPPGRYVMTPCVGDGPLSCVAQEAGGVAFQVGDGRLLEVVPGWNLATADRINVVFVPAGDTTVEWALSNVRAVLGWEGPLLLDGQGEPVVEPGQEVWSIRFGPFATEPLRSERQRFNLWMLDDVVVDAHVLDHTAPPVGWDRPPPDFGFPDPQVTVVERQFHGRFDRSHAFWPSFSAPFGHVPITRDGLVFGSAYLAVSRYNPYGYAETLTHEWGHGIFDLRDEYSEYERGVTYGYPNCAPDLETATLWWGDLVGAVDPFVDELIEVHRRYRVPIAAADIRRRVTVGYVDSGCYSLRADAVRPTEDSLMNSELAVFGAVNRRRVEEVLAAFSGRAPFSLDLVEVDCRGLAVREAVVSCGFSLAESVDLPAGAVWFHAGDRSSRCVYRPGDGTRFSCGVLRVTGAGPWIVRLSADDRGRPVVVGGPLDPRYGG